MTDSWFPIAHGMEAELHHTALSLSPSLPPSPLLCGPWPAAQFSSSYRALYGIWTPTYRHRRAPPGSVPAAELKQQPPQPPLLAQQSTPGHVVGWPSLPMFQSLK